MLRIFLLRLYLNSAVSILTVLIRHERNIPMNRRCVDSVLGWLLGHQFVKSKGGYVYQSETCFRCGARAEPSN